MPLDPRQRRTGSASRVCGGLAAILLLVLAQVSGTSAKNAPQSASPAGPYNTVSFPRELKRLKSELEAARKSALALRALRDSLPATWTVTDGDQQYRVPTSPLTSRLDHADRDPAAREFQLNQARDFLDALAAETAFAPGLPPANTFSAKTALERILARPEFASRGAQSWWDRIRARINEMIFAALARLLRGLGGQKSLGEALLWFGIGAAVFFLAYWIFRRWFRAARLEEMALQSAGVPTRSWQQWIFSSRAAAAKGDYRVAIHCAYWAGIARLEELGALPADRAQTPREYLRALTKSSLLVSEVHSTRCQALSMLTSRLEEIWYGYHMATETEFLDSLAQLEVLGCHLV